MWRTIIFAVVLSGSLATTARGEDPAIEGFYGSGVEAYYTGDYVRAFNLLNGAVQAGTRDPRVFYFRGLAEMYLGRSPDAVRDFQKGAELESSETASIVDVGRSLERVQGPTRLTLERYRAAARLAAAAERERQRVLRYGNAAPPADARASAPPPAAAQQPAAAAEKPAAAAPAQQPAAANPFGAPAAPAAAPAENPFGAPAATPPAAGANPPPAQPAAENPFATPPKP